MINSLGMARISIEFDEDDETKLMNGWGHLATSRLYMMGGWQHRHISRTRLRETGEISVMWQSASEMRDLRLRRKPDLLI